MTVESIALVAPVDFASLSSHENNALRFYGTYVKAWADMATLRQTSPSRFYSDDHVAIMPDSTIISGNADLWSFMMSQYGQFFKTERECESLILLSDSDKQTHEIHVRFQMKIYVKAGDENPAAVVPQYFVYTLGKADEGAGTLGLQFRELKNYYDKSVIQRVATLST
jgi:hypothetical protein